MTPGMLDVMRRPIRFTKIRKEEDGYVSTFNVLYDGKLLCVFGKLGKNSWCTFECMNDGPMGNDVDRIQYARINTPNALKVREQVRKIIWAWETERG